MGQEQAWSAFQDVAYALATNGDHEQLLNLVMQKAVEVTESAAASIVLYNHHIKNFDRVFSYGLSDHFVNNMAFRPGGLADEAFVGAKEILSNDQKVTKHKLSRLIHQENITCFLCLPLEFRDMKVGVLYTYRKDRDNFTEEEKSFLRNLISLATMSIENMRLETERKQQARRQAHLYDLIASLNDCTKLETLGQLVSQGITALAPSDIGAFILVDPDTAVPKAFVYTDLTNSNEVSDVVQQYALQSLLEKKVVLINDFKNNGHWQTPDTGRVKNFLFAPFTKEAQYVGGILVANARREGGYDSADVEAVDSLALHVGTTASMVEYYEQIQRSAVTDGLTDLANHREFQKLLGIEVERSRRYAKKFSLLLLDIDFFKACNDTHGHLSGDKILQSFASLIQKQLRTVDVTARYGGEEFAVILPETGTDGVKNVAEKLRRAIQDHEFETYQGTKIHITASIGISVFPIDGSEQSNLIDCADQALYFAKESGRNTVHAYAESLKAQVEKDITKLEPLLQDQDLQTLNNLAIMIDAKTAYNRGHSKEVANIATNIAKHMGLSKKEIEHARLAGLIHDLGTISVPAHILNKPDKLSPEERVLVEEHTTVAKTFIKKATSLYEVLPFILHHHERYDGTGYPKKLRGEEIPKLSRILSVAESYQAMVSNRPYRPYLTHTEAITELRSNAGTQFDSEVVGAFVDLIKNNQVGKTK